MPTRWYAVRVGLKPAIYSTLGAALAVCDGCSGKHFQMFKSLLAAEEQFKEWICNNSIETVISPGTQADEKIVSALSFLLLSLKDARNGATLLSAPDSISPSMASMASPTLTTTATDDDVSKLDGSSTHCDSRYDEDNEKFMATLVAATLDDIGPDQPGQWFAVTEIEPITQASRKGAKKVPNIASNLASVSQELLGKHISNPWHIDKYITNFKERYAERYDVEWEAELVLANKEGRKPYPLNATRAAAAYSWKREQDPEVVKRVNDMVAEGTEKAEEARRLREEIIKREKEREKEQAKAGGDEPTPEDYQIGIDDFVQGLPSWMDKYVRATGGAICVSFGAPLPAKNGELRAVHLYAGPKVPLESVTGSSSTQLGDYKEWRSQHGNVNPSSWKCAVTQPWGSFLKRAFPQALREQRVLGSGKAKANAASMLDEAAKEGNGVEGAVIDMEVVPGDASQGQGRIGESPARAVIGQSSTTAARTAAEISHQPGTSNKEVEGGKDDNVHRVAPTSTMSLHADVEMYSEVVLPRSQTVTFSHVAYK
ncbi:hypothetical protein M422DRAFT_262129 [Sphaerobolus stellatus SS14]|uniref:Ribonuclease H1 N-terminal domain-containing protein n=1 Tax=Sphaerobolus stellatus (strain SS14) TaxID=990650 RepID=A0A0C9V1I9_SPHS4|nr:hypothetical protein M422DRAFT_262129 [Sphaerobolus stellatus SS14]